MEPDPVDVARRALARGYTVTAAAAKAGVARETLHAWMRQDHTLREARDLGLSKLERAVLKDALKDGKLALDLLSRRCPKAFGRKDQMKVDGKLKHSVAPSGVEAVAQLESMLRALRGES